MKEGSVTRIASLIRKEFLALLGDRVSCVLLIFPPIMQLIVFSFAASQEIVNVRLGVMNLDQGVQSAALVRSFKAEPVFREVITLRGYRELDAALDQRKIIAAVVIPEDFSQKVASNSGAEIALTLDGRRANASGILGGYIGKIAHSYDASLVTQRSASVNAGSSGVITRYWFNPNLNARNSFIPGLVCITMTTVGMLASAMSIAREREFGTFEQLLVSPLKPYEIVLGKAFTAVVLGTLSSTLVLLVVLFGFKLPLHGPLWLFYATTILYLTSIVSVGLCVSSLSITQQQATLGIFLFLPPAVMTSGYATPIENMPIFLQHATVINPVRWQIDVLKGLFLRGSQLTSIALCLIPLACVAAVSLGAAIFMFKRRME
ncbi:MAG: ABC transporter permease [Planctomycetia bacterium]|nr:ABC transporter permease [Planctomycetia bacterium]